MKKSFLSDVSDFLAWYRRALIKECAFRTRGEDLFAVLPLGFLRREPEEALFALVTLLLTGLLIIPMLALFVRDAASGDLGRAGLAVVIAAGLNGLALGRLLACYRRTSRQEGRLARLRGL